MALHGTPWNHMAFHGTPSILHGIPWILHETPSDSMELHEYSMELHGYSMDTPWNSLELHGSSIEFLGFLWNSMDFHGIPWRYFTRVEQVCCQQYKGPKGSVHFPLFLHYSFLPIRLLLIYSLFYYSWLVKIFLGFVFSGRRHEHSVKLKNTIMCLI